MRNSARIWRHFDTWLLTAVSVLTIAGIAMIRSAIGGNPNLEELAPRQAIYAVFGLVVLFLFAAIDYRFWSALSRPLYIFTVALLGLIQIAGAVGFGSARWFNIVIVSVQPSEVAKILMILVLADFLANHRHEINQPKVLLRSAALIALPAGLVFLQPDLSTAIVLIVIWLALLWASGVRLKYFGIVLLLLVVVFITIAPLLAHYFIVDYSQEHDFLFMEYYQMQRVANFLFPDTEARYGAAYNVDQSLISIGSGGWFGQGYGHGTQVQLRFLKVRHTDFIFSAMAEEFGFVGTVVFIAIFTFIIFRCLRAASIARDTYGSLICYAVAILLLFQGFFNIGMNLNLFPVSGLPLPFLSYGGSSLFTSLLGIGLVESVNLRHKWLEL